MAQNRDMILQLWRVLSFILLVPSDANEQPWVTISHHGKRECCHENLPDKSTGLYNLNIIGLFAMTGDYPAGMSYLPSALLAVKHINNDSTLLPGYKLQLNAYDTSGTVEWALDAFFTEVYNTCPHPIMVMGGTRSHVTEATAPVSKLWGMCQVSYSAVSPYLSDKKHFPTFFRVLPPEQDLTVARIKLLKAMNWKRVHIIYQNQKLFSTLVDILENDLEKNGISVVGQTFFVDDPTESVRALKALDARIIIGSFHDDIARRVMCTVYEEDRNGEWYKKIVWVLPSFYVREWITGEHSDTNCTTDIIREVTGNYFSMGPITNLDDNGFKAVGKYPSGPQADLYSAVKDDIPSKFSHLYDYCQNNTYSPCILTAQHRAPEAYDAVWAIAYALNNTQAYLKESEQFKHLSLKDFDFGVRNKEFPGIILEQMKKVEFDSLSGHFKFNERGERASAFIEIVRYISEDKKFIRVGNCTDCTSRDICNCTLYPNGVTWKSGKPPLDGVQTRSRLIEIDLRVTLTFCILAGIGILTSAGLLIFNIKLRNVTFLRKTSPALTNIMLIGSMLAYSTVIFSMNIGNDFNPVACMVPVITVVSSFCLGFGSMVVKNWRVYQIFSAGAKVLNTKMLKDLSLFMFVAALLLVNGLIIASWFVISPESRTLVNISHTPPVHDLDIVYVNQIPRCESPYGLHFTIALIAVQGMVMVFGTFLAIQIQKIPDSYIKCVESSLSKRFAWVIFTVNILAPTTVILVMVTRDQPEINFAVKSSMIIFITTTALIFVFAPKIIAFRKYRGMYTQTENVKPFGIYFLNKKDFTDVECAIQGICDLQRTRTNTDKSDSVQSDTGIQRRGPDCPWATTSTMCDAWQQTDSFSLTTTASISSSPISGGTKGHALTKRIVSSFHTFPSQYIVTSNASKYRDLISRQRSKSDSFIRSRSFDQRLFSKNQSLVRKRSNLSNSTSEFEVRVMTDMKVKSKMQFQRSRSEIRNDVLKKARIEFLESVKEGANFDSDVSG